MLCTTLLFIPTLSAQDDSVCNNIIRYEAKKKLFLFDDDFGDAKVVTHTFKNGKGTLIFDRPVTKIGGDGYGWIYSPVCDLYFKEVFSKDAIAQIKTFHSLKSFTIPDSVTEIEAGSFTVASHIYWARKCYPSHLTSFYGKFAYDGGKCLVIDGKLLATALTGLTEYTIPEGVTRVAEMAITGCDQLQRLTINDDVTSIGEYAFACAPMLEGVYLMSHIPPVLDGDEVLFNSDHYPHKSECKIYVPRDSVDTYKTASGWSKYADNIIGYDFK